jgi:Citrate synthase, C-terminal domain
VVDHGLNASTFTARVIVSTGSDFVSAISGAIGALKGPLHGGAPGPALDMVFEIGDAARAEPYLRDKLARGEKLMGFGHRVYKVRDPRADVLNTAAERMFRRGGDMKLYELARAWSRLLCAFSTSTSPAETCRRTSSSTPPFSFTASGSRPPCSRRRLPSAASRAGLRTASSSAARTASSGRRVCMWARGDEPGARRRGRGSPKGE